MYIRSTLRSLTTALYSANATRDRLMDIVRTLQGYAHRPLAVIARR